MPDAEAPLVSNTQIRPFQLIVGAMAIGVVAFLAVALILRATTNRAPPAEGEQPLVTYIAVAYGIGTILVGPYLSRSITACGRRRVGREADDAAAALATAKETPAGDEPNKAAKLFEVFRVKVLIGAAMDEAAGLFACIAYFIEGRFVAAGLTVILVLSLLMNMPTAHRTENWLAEQLRLLEDEGHGTT